MTSNRIAVPALTTLARLIDSGIADTSLPETVYARALALAARGIPTLKSIDRITAAMRVVVACLSLPSEFTTRTKAVDALAPLLAHRFPRIRAMTAEAVYLFLSIELDELDPELEECLLETAWAQEEGVARAPEAVEMLRTALNES